MSESGVQDTFGSRVGLSTLIAASVIVILFTWVVFVVLGGHTKRASQEINAPGYPKTNATMPLHY